jgi:hypothetical protein
MDYPIIRNRATGHLALAHELSGIERAVRVVRTQTELARLISEAAGEPISQARVSCWIEVGYVPRRRAGYVSEVTGVPVDDLVRKGKGKPRGRHAGLG